jgi:alkanesulfonate monooxygenase SsuD/methylene tetrahydromethanopterin reductase-like flavin-dependent oxidoreductase (luciferase family)
MFLMYFTEQPMNTYPEDEGRKAGHTVLLFSNRNFDPVAGSRLYNERLAEYVLADEVGFDGIMLNEHHNAPYCMQPRIPVWSSILAAVTKKAKIVQLGNPLPVSDNPVQIAEEIAMIDMISKGRLISGIVRGAGTEQLANNVNPAFNRERFEEAHDLLVKTFTTPGPFRWEGNHYQFRVVNPWAVPLQKPHPRIWVPGVLSTDTIIWSAKHRYPYIALNTTIEATKKIWELYDKTAAECGYTSGPEQRGYLIRAHVAETEEKAEANARQFMWMEGEFTGLGHPIWALPTGYVSASVRRMRLEMGHKNFPALPFEKQSEDLTIIWGTPKTVVRKLRRIMEETRPGIFALWGNDGKVSHEDSKTCIRLMGQEVVPQLREIARELDLKDPFEAGTPVSLAETPPEQLRPHKEMR